MAACEKCWGDAYRRMRYTGRSQTDCYNDLLEERKDDPCTLFEQTGGKNDCDTCHGIGSVELFTGDLMLDGNPWRGAGGLEVRCPECNRRKNG